MTDEFPVPVADLQVALKDKAAVVRQAAVLVLGQLAPSQAAVVPALIEALADEDPDVRHGAVFFLADAGPAADSALPALLKLLKQAEPKTQDAILLALGNIGQRNQAVLPCCCPSSRTISRGKDARRRSRPWAAWLRAESLRYLD